ncbi:MAG: carbamoyltransferase HypF [Desulfobacterales bacterium]|nr:carbamoyltransferase HypF [Desulfobacterales bacterium]
MINTARRIEITGIVQGVGFRPFVYEIASKYLLKGIVYNTSSGVLIHIEGNQQAVDSFCKEIYEKHPPLAYISEINHFKEDTKGFSDFKILGSIEDKLKSTLISPDISTCSTCLNELYDSNNLRYLYPFINCTDCGPRFTVIEKTPYDRKNTSMSYFKMCEACRTEYTNPQNRRFHAEIIACAKCGPQIFLYDNNKKSISTKNPIKKAIEILSSGYILAIKGIGGFQLAVDATNQDAVIRLREKKYRKDKPLAVMSNMEHILKYAYVDDTQKLLLKQIASPIVLLEKKEPFILSNSISPNNKYIGVMLPYTPLHILLLENFLALVMTSGNKNNEPIAKDNDEAFDNLSEIADYFLIHNRPILRRVDDSVIKIINNTPRFIRRARGYSPLPIIIKKNIPMILGCGADLKNTFCLTQKNKIFVSQHIGDIENFETYTSFKSTIEDMKKLFGINPEIVSYDMHPGYLTSKYAMELADIKKISVQHHHAHIASCMAEYCIDEPVIGLAFDGTGYGTDGNIWGGEILVCEYKNFLRVGHLSYMPMPGGDLAVKEPWRMAISYLYSVYKNNLLNLDLPILKNIEEKKINIVIEMISKGINTPYTSSMGRLFDGIASIIGIRDKISFEGQAAIELEIISEGNYDSTYDYECTSKDLHKILLDPIILGIVKDMRTGIQISKISKKFHNTIISIFSNLCSIIYKETGLKKVVLSGGVFQNSHILSGLTQSLERNNFEVFSHKLVSTNDSGICLGQVMIASAIQ